jgi:hypothetical protein
MGKRNKYCAVGNLYIKEIMKCFTLLPYYTYSCNQLVTFLLPS